MDVELKTTPLQAPAQRCLTLDDFDGINPGSRKGLMPGAAPSGARAAAAIENLRRSLAGGALWRAGAATSFCVERIM